MFKAQYIFLEGQKHESLYGRSFNETSFMNILVVGRSYKMLSDWIIPLNKSTGGVAVFLVSDLYDAEQVIQSGFEVGLVIFVKPDSPDLPESLKKDIEHFRSISRSTNDTKLMVLRNSLDPKYRDLLRRLGVNAAVHPQELLTFINTIREKNAFIKFRIIRNVSWRHEPELIEHKIRNRPCLTPRQREVLSLLNLGKSNKQIARDLDLTEGTVKVHCKAIFRALGVNNRTQAAVLLANSPNHERVLS
ncbi:MAG: response regulator transcription factor [Granulosicoccus sp.]